MNILNTEYKHELIIPNEIIPIKVFSFSAHNDLRIIPFHWHNSAEILFVKRGKLIIWMKEKKYELKANDLIFINSKEVHSTQSPEDNEVIVLQIPGDLLNTFSNNESLNIHCNSIEVAESKELSKVREIIYRLYVYSERKEEVYYLKVYSLIFELGYILVKYYRVKSRQVDINSNKHLDQLTEICSFIEEKYKENLTLNELASYFGYTPQYLSKLFHKYTGTTYLKYLNSVRLSHAFKQIENTDYSILDIAVNNGFTNVKSFNKVFKDSYGMTPSVYRKTKK